MSEAIRILESLGQAASVPLTAVNIERLLSDVAMDGRQKTAFLQCDVQALVELNDGRSMMVAIQYGEEEEERSPDDDGTPGDDDEEE